MPGFFVSAARQSTTHATSFHFECKGRPVRFSSDGWLHSTKVADVFGKRLDRWQGNAETLEYIRSLDESFRGGSLKF